MVMKREAISRNGVWTGKKHYILDVYDNEGVRYAKPKLKTMGMEAVYVTGVVLPADGGLTIKNA